MNILMMRICVPILALLLLWLPVVVQAIYEDEAYKTDYQYELLGVPQPHTTFFHRPSAASKASLLYTLSEKFVLGAVNPKDGTIVWRQQLAAGNSTSGGYLRAEEGGGAITSAVNGKVEAWNAGDGRLDWSWAAPGSVRGLELLSRKGYTDVLVFSDEEGSKGVIRKLASGSGNVVWEHKDESGDTPHALATSKEEVFSIALHGTLLKGYKIKITTLDVSTGIQKSQQNLNSENEVGLGSHILFAGSDSAAPLLIWTDSSFKVIKVNVLGHKHVESLNVGKSNSQPIQEITIHAPRTTNGLLHFLVHYQSSSSHWAEVYHADAASGSVRKAYGLSETAGIGAFSSSTEGEKVYFTRHTGSDIILLSSLSATSIQTWPIHRKSLRSLDSPAGIVHAVSEVVPKGSSSFAVRSALTLSSGDWELIRNGDPVWLRSESIAGIVAAAWVKFNKEESLIQMLATESHSGALGAYAQRFRRHFGDVVTYLPGFIETLPEQIMGLFIAPKEADHDPSPGRDAFGFKKMVIAATKRGRVALLDTSNQGKIIWNIQVVDILPHHVWSVLDITVRDNVITIHGPEGERYRLDVLAGKLVQNQPGGSSASLRTSPPILDCLGNEVALSKNRDGSVNVPSESHLRKETVLTTKGEDGIAKGWLVGQGTKPRIIWQFNPAPGEVIESLTRRPTQDPVASIGKALGDRNVMYKYLNPNLVVITTIARAASKAAVYLLDSSTGEILHISRHSGVDTARPIVITMTENWFAYSIYIDPSTAEPTSAANVATLPKGHQLIISELFESSIPNDRGPFGSSSNFSSIHSTTSDIDSTLSLPHVVSQAYLVPGPIAYLTTTSTLQSITPRSLLCILPSINGIISIPRNVIDPRRPVGRDPTPAEAEEGLFRHNHMLDFEPKWVITHQREVMGLTTVITSPSLLESTSLVFAYGNLDVFGTRVSPIGGFDILGKGFSRFQLMATVVGLAIGTGALAPMVRKKQIDGIWKA